MPTSLTDKQKRDHRQWNKGYRRGYQRLAHETDQSEIYYIAYEVGRSDRAEDDEAMESGTFDLLNEDEREEIYGNEKDRI